MKKNTDKIYATALYEALDGKTDVEPIVREFLKFLQEKALLHRIDKIIREFERVYNEKNNIAKLKIKSANTLSDEILQKIAQALKLERYELETELDKDLIGGFVAQYNDNYIDASVKNNLNKLHNQLKQ